MGCDCGKPKCDGKCGISPAVLQITNPSECVLFHKVVITSAMGNEVTTPPATGLYKNTLLYYESTGNAYLYSSDGIPTLISFTDYLRLLNKPSINGVTLVGDKSLSDLGINDAALTIKQNGNTLGTFSANASENVEINIPGGDGDALLVSLTVSNEDIISGLAFRSGVALSGGRVSGGMVFNSSIESSYYTPTFTNDATGEDVSPEDVFNAVASSSANGKRVIFNKVPLGWWVDSGGNTITSGALLSSGLSVNTAYSYVDETGETQIYSGAAFIDGLPLGFSIAKTTSGGAVSYRFESQGMREFSLPS